MLREEKHFLRALHRGHLAELVIIMVYDFLKTSYPFFLDLRRLGVEAEGSIESEKDEDVLPTALSVFIIKDILRENFYQVTEGDRLLRSFIFLTRSND